MPTPRLHPAYGPNFICILDVNDFSMFRISFWVTTGVKLLPHIWYFRSFLAIFVAFFDWLPPKPVYDAQHMCLTFIIGHMTLSIKILAPYNFKFFIFGGQNFWFWACETFKSTSNPSDIVYYQVKNAYFIYKFLFSPNFIILICKISAPNPMPTFRLGAAK